MIISTHEKIQFVSDVHLEYHSDYENKRKWWRYEIIPSAPYLILAGDIAPADHHALPSFYKWCFKNFEKVLHCPGNHEYWSVNKNQKRTIRETNDYLQNLCENYGIIFAQEKVVYLNEKIPPIICCTLWCNSEDISIVRKDFSNILNFTPAEERKINLKHVSFIATQLNKFKNNCIVVTHHSPLKEGTQKKELENDIYSRSYVNDLPQLVDLTSCWIFGHTHFVCDIVREGGNVVCSNPIGTKKEKLNYDKSAIIKIY